MTMADVTTSEVGRDIERWRGEYGGPDAAVAHLLCDRHPYSDAALTVVRSDMSARTYSYAGLKDMSGRVARVLSGLGVGRGDRVATLLPKGVELVATALGIWRLGAVHVPLFTAFAPGAIGYRLADSGAHIVVTDDGNRHKLLPGEELPADPARRIVTVGGGPIGDVDFWSAVDAACDPIDDAARVGGAAPFIQLYTSGTTGDPKGVVLPVRALASIEAYLRLGLHLRPGDVYWNAADPGWAYGLYYAIVGPLLIGHPTLQVAAPFDAAQTFRVLREHDVTTFAAAPTVYRTLRAEGDGVDVSGLRLKVLASAGEPLGADVVEWAEARLGVPILDHFGQTETGMIVNNHAAPAAAVPLRPPSMGTAMPGFDVVVLDPTQDRVAPTGELGRVAVDVRSSPLFWFEGYHAAPDRTAERFSADRRYYLTGDIASRDEDGYFTFSARADDVIITAGYRTGPTEIERVLQSHPDVAEAAAVGLPDEKRGEAIHAFVVLSTNRAGDAILTRELQDLVRNHLARHAYPRTVHYVDELPRTPSGKLQRFVLRGS